METLGESFKGKYPFRLGTTSFIYPDLYSENVRRLGPFVDEIELLFFESNHPDSLPGEHEMRQLAELSAELDISYNVHLPTDVFIASANPYERKAAVDVLSTFIKTISILNPVTYTLHIPHESHPGGDKVWQAYAFKGLRTLLENGMDPGLISVETLDYSPEHLVEIVDEFDLSICLDVGHMITHGFDPVSIFHKFKERISIIHLHGVHNGNDHVALDLMPEKEFAGVKTILNEFSGSLSIEVFSFSDLERSLDCIKRKL